MESRISINQEEINTDGLLKVCLQYSNLVYPRTIERGMGYTIHLGCNVCLNCDREYLIALLSSVGALEDMPISIRAGEARSRIDEYDKR